MADRPSLIATGVATLNDPKTVRDAGFDHFAEFGTVTHPRESGQIDMSGCTHG